MLNISADSPLSSVLDLVFDPLMAAVRQLELPGWAMFLAGIGALLGAFSLLDRALPEVSAERSGFQRIGTLVYRPVAMFLLGCAVTSVTMSVSVSLSVLVPLSARGLVRRENTLPYIMGANITTFIDTLVAALVTGGPAAFMIVLVEMLSVTCLSVLILVFCYRPFSTSVLRLQEAIIKNNTRLGLFLGVMLLVPVILLLVQ
jgi:sodium-dependent phosphate cotransporter